jgi:protein SCO1/2
MYSAPRSMRQVIVLLVLSCAACSEEAMLGLRRFQLTGVVVGRETSPPRIVVAHDAVNGLMPAMTMTFEVGAAKPPPLTVGDRIAATLILSDTRTWLEDVKVIGRNGAAETDATAVSRAIPGAVVPDLPLVDQNGAPFTLRDGVGRVRIVTFIYTRCPLPDFCPLMVRHLESVRRRADKEGVGIKLALLGVTLDPAFDTPAVLRVYGESMLKGSTRFDQWTLATGTPAQIENVARFFGVGYRADGGLVTHTLATAVVGKDGRVMRIFESNSWRPDEVYDVVRRGIELPVR